MRVIVSSLVLSVVVSLHLYQPAILNRRRGFLGPSRFIAKVLTITKRYLAMPELEALRFGVADNVAEFVRIRPEVWWHSRHQFLKRLPAHARIRDE